MSKLETNISISPPKEQLMLYCYNEHFNSFVKLYNKKKLPNVILLEGLKGSGKSTFAYHFINYMLSFDEKYSYSVEEFKINPENLTYKFIQNNTHPNFFLLERDLSESYIKIDQVRSLLKFLTKSAYKKNKKIVLIDSADHLNNNSSNALLHCLEEQSENTFFFIISNNLAKVQNTIKSRCVEYRFHFNFFKKKEIFDKITTEHQLNLNNSSLVNFFNFDTPGNILRYFHAFYETDFNFSEDILTSIYYLMDQYKNKKESYLINFISIFIESYYNNLSFNNPSNSNAYFTSRDKILYLINDMQNYNLDKKNLLIEIDNILTN